MQNTLKRFIAPVRYLRRYNNPFWKWVEKLDRVNLWESTVELYSVDVENGHETLNSMIVMCKRIMYSAQIPVSEKFHLQFCNWEGELQKAELISQTLKLHKITDMLTLEARIFSLRKVGSRSQKAKLRLNPGIEDTEDIDEVTEYPPFSEIQDPNSTPVKMFVSICKKQDRIKSSSSESKSLFDSLHALTQQSIGSLNMHGIHGSLDELSAINQPSSPVNVLIPDSFKRKYSHGDTLSAPFINPVGTQSIAPILQVSKLTESDTLYSKNVVSELRFPFKGNPLETIVGLTQEVVEAKLAINPEAWIKPYFLTSVWEMFHFGEEKIGNFVIAPNYLRGKDEEPSLDIFFWSGIQDNPSLYACQINREKDVFFLHESDNTFPSLVSLVAFYAFNLTDDLPAILKSPCITELVPSIDLPCSITLQELYIIQILEYNPECWLTQNEFDGSELRSEVGSFIIYENLYSDFVKLYVRADTQLGLRVDSYEISMFENGLGLVNSKHQFASLASLISHYSCWPTEDLCCLLKIPTFDLPENDTVNSMHLISSMVEEVYIARDLSLHPDSWYIPNTNPDSIVSKLMDQPIKTFTVVEYEKKYKLMLRYPIKESPIQSYNIIQSNSEYSIFQLTTWFPSLPLLIAYLCRNECTFLPVQLSVPKFTPIDIKNNITAKFQSPIDSFPEENFLRNVRRKSGKINLVARQSQLSLRSTKRSFEYMQQLVIKMTENPDFWSCSDISEAMERIILRQYRSFMVVHSSGSRECPLLLVRNNEKNPMSVAQFKIYQSKSGTCGFMRDTFIYSSLTSLLAQCCCVVDTDLPFLLFYERCAFDQSSC